jgi:hypothetical protein
MKRITEFTIPLGGIGGTYVVEHKHGENLCTVFAKNKTNHIWKKPKEEVDGYFSKQYWITSKEKLELPSKFYITTSPDATAYKYLVTETEGGNYSITGFDSVAWWKWEDVESFILEDTWTYFPIESASSFEAEWIIVDEMNELENIIAKWQIKNPESIKNPLANDFYFNCPCGFAVENILYRAIKRDGKYIVSWKSPEEGGRKEELYTVEEVEKGFKMFGWTVVEFNGVDASGFPFNFTKDMLKPSMRFAIGNGDRYIAVESEIMDDIGNINVEIIGASNNKGWTGFELVNIYGDELGEEFRAMAVYEKSADNNHLLIPEHNGKLIWQAIDSN